MHAISAPSLQMRRLSLQLVTGSATHDRQVASHLHHCWISMETLLHPRSLVRSHFSAFAGNSNGQKLSVRPSVRCRKRSSHRKAVAAAALTEDKSARVRERDQVLFLHSLLAFKEHSPSTGKNVHGLAFKSR